MRAFLKTIFPESLFPFLRAIDKYIIDTTYCYLAIKHFICRDKARQAQAIFQSKPTFKTQILFDPEPSANLTAILDSYGVSYKSGRHSVYISKKSDLEKISSELVDRNLPTHGLKIFKSREISADGTPYYTSRILAPASTYCSMMAVGSVAEKVIVSNLLHAEGVAPRVYDLIVLESENGVRYHALIVQHIEGPVVHGKEGIEFLHNLKVVFKRLGISVVSITEHCDLRPPYFRDNIIKNESSIYYVDIQNFTVTNQRKSQNLRNNIAEKYQEDKLSAILANKEEVIFFRHLDAIFKKNELKPQDYFFVDSCRGAGVGILSILSLGGKWGFLLRSKEECSDLNSFHYLRGNTRFDCVSHLHDLKNIIKEYNYSGQNLGIICDTVSDEVETIARWASCKVLIVIDDSKERGSAATGLFFEDVKFNLTEQVTRDENSSVFMMSLYMRETIGNDLANCQSQFKLRVD